MRVEGSVTINRPVKDVWDFVLEPSNGPKYEKGLLEQRYTSDGRAGVGTELLRVSKIMGQTSRNTYKVTEFEEHKKVTYAPLTGPGPVDVGFTFESAGQGTKFNYWLQSHPKGLEKVIELLFGGMIRGGMTSSFARLKSLMESGG
ncbi:MAG: hypothetical protein FJ317_05010 [SAR202 cluster bacterium]|nr:hypothetical protein [SAR202 cluster bacterium]